MPRYWVTKVNELKQTVPWGQQGDTHTCDKSMEDKSWSLGVTFQEGSCISSERHELGSDYHKGYPVEIPLRIQRRGVQVGKTRRRPIASGSNWR